MPSSPVGKACRPGGDGFVKRTVCVPSSESEPQINQPGLGSRQKKQSYAEQVRNK